MVKTKGYHHGNLRAALLEAAVKLLSERGPEGLILRELARRAGVSHAAPYRHFADKNALLAAVAQEGFAELRTKLIDAAASTDSVEDKIVAAGAAYVRFAADCPAQFDLMFGPYVSEPERHPEFREASAAAFGVLVELVAQGQEEARLVEGSPTDLATFAWAAVHGLASLRASNRAPANADTAKTVASRVLLGLKKRA